MTLIFKILILPMMIPQVTFKLLRLMNENCFFLQLILKKRVRNPVFFPKFARLWFLYWIEKWRASNTSTCSIFRWFEKKFTAGCFPKPKPENALFGISRHLKTLILSISYNCWTFTIAFHYLYFKLCITSNLKFLLYLLNASVTSTAWWPLLLYCHKFSRLLTL